MKNKNVIQHSSFCVNFYSYRLVNSIYVNIRYSITMKIFFLPHFLFGFSYTFLLFNKIAFGISLLLGIISLFVLHFKTVKLKFKFNDLKINFFFYLTIFFFLISCYFSINPERSVLVIIYFIFFIIISLNLFFLLIKNNESYKKILFFFFF